MSNMYDIINKSFTQYAGAVLQSRALVDVRDCLKPSARQIFYCMYTDNFTSDKPFKKTLKAIGSAMRTYIHGDSSCEGIIMRAGQPFSMRYPLVEVEGSYGNLIASGNYAAPRYTSSRLSQFSNYLFNDINKNVIDEWRDNYDNTEQYPSVLPSKGFYNIVNGTMGIGIGAASSIPQFNLREVNEALIKLLWDSEVPFEDIYCAPDFATGGVLLNESQVKESLKNGEGFACKLRSVIEYDNKDNCFIVTEIPYSVYTETICGELNKIIESEENPGIERYNDLTGNTPLIKIYLTKKANQFKILKYLYSNTSLQYHYGINMTMLKDGRFPKVFGWREALLEHISHEKEVYKKGFEFDLNKVLDRLHIVEGILIALASIEEVISTIKNSKTTALANIALQNNFLLSEKQAKAVLDMKLSRLAHLEVEKYQKEKQQLETEKKRIETILNDDFLFKKEIEKGFKEVANKYGDARRTKLLDLNNNSDDEIIEQKDFIIQLTNYGNLYISENSTLMVQKRNRRGEKININPNDYICDAISGTSSDILTVFSNKGKYYNIPLKEVTEGTNIGSYINLSNEEKINKIVIFNKNNTYKYIIFVTKNGIIKKSLIEEYKSNRRGGSTAIKLKDGDSICSIIFCNDELIGVTTNDGYFTLFSSTEINPVGKLSIGVKGPKLNDNSYITSAKLIPKNTKEIVSISENGKISRTSFKEFNITSRTAKGTKIQKILEDDILCSFVPVLNNNDLIISSNFMISKLSLESIPLTQKGSAGVKSIKLKNSEKIIEILEEKI